MKKLKKSYKKVKKKLGAIDLSVIDSAASDLARKQADAALVEALADTGLTDKQIKKIRKKVRNSIDLSGISARQIKEVKDAVNALAGAPDLKTPSVDWDQKEAKKILKKMDKQVDILLSHSGRLLEMSREAEKLGGMLSEMSKGVNELADGGESLYKGIKAFSDGIDALDKGAAQLKKGSGRLKSAGNEMVDGMDELRDNVRDMADGLKEFRDEDMDDLTDLSGPELKRIVNTIRALRKNDIRYENFSGILPGKTGEVRFLIETEEIDTE